MTIDDDSKPDRKRGRPVGKRGTFSFRVTQSLRQKLEDAAAASERPVSEEIERRLELSFDEDLAGLRRSLFGEPNTELLLRKIAWAARLIEGVGIGQAGHPPVAWSDSPEMRAALREAIREIVVDATPYDLPVRATSPVLAPFLGEEAKESDVLADAIADAQDRGRSVGRLVCGNVAAIKVAPLKDLGIGTQKDW